MSRVFDLLTVRPRLSLLLVLVVTVLVGLGALRLRIDFSPEQVYVGQDDAVRFCEHHKQLFRFEDSIVLMLLESTDGNSLLREDCLRWLQEFAIRCQPLEGVREVTSLVTLQRPRFRGIGPDRVSWSPWLPEQNFGNADFLQRQLKQLPLLNDTLISQDQRLMLTLIDLDPESRAISTVTRRVRAIDQVLAELPVPNGTATSISGVPAIRVDVIQSIFNDQIQMVPVCSALFILVSLMIFRSFTVTLLSMFAALASVALTTGLIGWCGLTFSLMSNVVPVLLLIIAAANSVHILSHFQVEVRQSELDLKSCAKSTMVKMSHTCFLTLLTSAIGFGSLLLARAELLQSLAVQAAGGMACCYVSLMVIMPQTLVLCGPALCRRSGRRSSTELSADEISEDRDDSTQHHRSDKAIQSSRLQVLWRRIGSVISRYPAPIVALHLLLAAWTLWSCRNTAINSYLFETYDGGHPTMAVVRKLDQQMSGLVSLEIQLRAENKNRLFEQDMVAGLAGIRRLLQQDPRITFYRDYVQFLAVFDHNRPLDSDPVAAAASLRRVQLALRQLNNPVYTSSFVGKDEPVVRIMMRVRDIGSAGINELSESVTAIMQRMVPRDIQYNITGDAYLHAICMDSFVRDLFYSLIAASGVIFLLITLLFRSLRIGMISALPNIFPLVMTLGYMHLRGYELTAGNVIVFAISLGIAVDDTIHFLARYRDERRSAGNSEAIQNTLFASGRAIVLTSVLVVSGLSILVFSDFVPTRRFAELTAITMCAALPGDLILLPALLQLFGVRPTPIAHEATEVQRQPPA